MSIQNGFTFPQLFVEMDKEGCLNSGNFIDMNHFDSQKYLWFYDMEWIPCVKITNSKRPDYQSDLIVAFAQTGGGDLWGWHLGHLPVMPVVFCPHDDDEAVYYAASFEAAIFRHILEFVSQNNFSAYSQNSWEMDIVNVRVLLSTWKNRFSKYFKQEWNEEIDKLLSQEFKFYKPNKSSEYYVLITPEEVEILIDKYLKFDLLGQNFMWTV